MIEKIAAGAAASVAIGLGGGYEITHQLTEQPFQSKSAQIGCIPYLNELSKHEIPKQCRAFNTLFAYQGQQIGIQYTPNELALVDQAHGKSTGLTSEGRTTLNYTPMNSAQFVEMVQVNDQVYSRSQDHKELIGAIGGGLIIAALYGSATCGLVYRRKKMSRPSTRTTAGPR